MIDLNGVKMEKDSNPNPSLEIELQRAISIVQQAGLKIADREELLQSIIDHAPFPISVVACPDLHYVLANPSMQSSLKTPDNFCLGSKPEQLYSSEFTRKRQRLLVQVQESGLPVHLHEVYAPTGPEEREAWWNLDFIPINDDKGIVKYILIMEYEVTDLVYDRQQLERSNHDLQEFAFVASHDLKEPLRKVNAFGEMLLADSENLTGQQRDYLLRMCSSAARMQNMVEELLKLSRLTTHPRTFIRVDLGQVISEVIMDLEVQLKGSSGKVDIEPLPVVIGDLLLLRQLFQNLIGNALKFHHADIPPHVRVYCEPLTGNAVRVLVQDNGIGFDMEDADRIFQPFQRLVSRSKYEGNGMGLAICRKIVERHGGTITATSQPGQGSTFIVTLPLGYTRWEERD
jgi:signal transduction histidine kinase